MNTQEPNKITVKSAYDIIITHELPWDADLEEWIQTFKSILVGLSFDEEMVKERFEQDDADNN